MMQFTPYIMFNGNAEEALEFYGKLLGATEPPYIMRYSQAQGMDVPPEYMNKVLHAQLNFPGGKLYLSDSFPGQKTNYTDSISFNLAPDSEEHLETLFNGFAEGGTVVQPLERQFWGSIFGSVNDKFGIHWSFDFGMEE